MSFVNEPNDKKARRYKRNIPNELKKLNQWVLWDKVSPTKKGEHAEKIPYQKNDYRKAKSNDPKTWCSFDDAVEALPLSTHTGIGFEFTKPYIGLDIDDENKLDPKTKKKVLDFLKSNGAYIEKSQSGNGHHAIFKGFLPANVRHKSKDGHFEMYQDGRFFANTAQIIGKKIKDLPTFDGQQMLKLIKVTVGVRQQSANQPAVNTSTGNNFSPIELVKLACKSKQSPNFEALMKGDTSNYGGDDSAADIALCDDLAFWTNKDPAKMDEIFRGSKLYRKKWDEKRGAMTYGQRTIQRAIDDTTNGFTDKSSRPTMNYKFDFNQPEQGNLVPLPQHDQQTTVQSSKINLIRTVKGKIKTTSASNAVAIILHDPQLKDLFRYNEFTQEVEVAEDKKINTGNKSIPKLEFKQSRLTDDAVINTGVYIQSAKAWEQTIFPKDVLYDAVEVAARANKYNPIKDYFKEAYDEWDKKPRLDEFFPTYLGADDNETTRLIAELWFMGGAAKAENPYQKFDNVLDLAGDQGTGKTMIAQKLAPLGMYTDSMNTFHKPDDYAIMKDAFIVNDDEMAVTMREGFPTIKKFITMREFTYRAKYKHLPGTFPKHFLIVRTTNELAHLRDSSGDRRFMTITAHLKKRKKNPYYLTPDYVKQLWGEAYHLYKSLVDAKQNPFELAPEQEKLLKANREQFRYTTGLYDDIVDAIDNNFHGREAIGKDELSVAVFGEKDANRAYRKEGGTIKKYMERLGWHWKSTRKLTGQSKRAFVKEE